jgi:hypothetical protein
MAYDIKDYGAQSGRMIKEDGTTVNIADTLVGIDANIDGIVAGTTTLHVEEQSPSYEQGANFVFQTGKLVQAEATTGLDLDYTLPARTIEKIFPVVSIKNNTGNRALTVVLKPQVSPDGVVWSDMYDSSLTLISYTLVATGSTLKYWALPPLNVNGALVRWTVVSVAHDTGGDSDVAYITVQAGWRP